MVLDILTRNVCDAWITKLLAQLHVDRRPPWTDAEHDGGRFLIC